MHPVVIFDISDDMNESVIDEMKKMGYHTKWENRGEITLLPRNCVWKQDTESSQALSDLKQCVETIKNNFIGAKKIELLRCIILNSTPWEAIKGEKICFALPNFNDD